MYKWLKGYMVVKKHPVNGSNLKFISIRKYAGLEWETYSINNTDCYIALNHRSSICIESSSWSDLWNEIINKSKNIRKKTAKKQRKK